VSSKSFKATRFSPSSIKHVEDHLAVEAVLQLKLNGVSYTTTVRTPGADEALARGLLFTEGVLVDTSIVPEFHHVPDHDAGHTGCLEITVPEEALAKDVTGRRSAMVNASCGLCGIREPEELRMTGAPIATHPKQRLHIDAIRELTQCLSIHQPLFQATGGVHGALAFGADGTVLSAHEDIGRHNAVDKVIGDLIQQGRLQHGIGIVVSGRASYEIVFKAYQAQWPYILAVSAPSSLAVEMGEHFGMCIVGFCRENRATVYSRPELVKFE
jgi:FdhD protein